MSYFGGSLENKNAEKHANSGSLPHESSEGQGTTLGTGLEIICIVFCQRVSMHSAYLLKV